MSRESNLDQIKSERIAIEQEALNERGPDEVLAAPNPGVIIVSGEVAYKFPLGLSGSLTKLVNGDDYLLAGANVILTTGSNGSVTISAQAPSIEVGGLNTQVQFNDGGDALGGDSAFTYNKVSGTLTVTNISGSLTKLSNGSDYLIAGSGISLSTGSNGSITISSATPEWQTYTPTITATVSNPTLPTSHNIYGRYLIQGKVLTVIFSFSGNSSAGANAGSGDYVISLPSGFAVDTGLITLGTQGQNYLDGISIGTAALITDNAGTGGAWSVVPNAQTSVILLGQDPASSAQPTIWGSNNYSIGSFSSYRVSFAVTVPIV